MEGANYRFLVYCGVFTGKYSEIKLQSVVCYRGNTVCHQGSLEPDWVGISVLTGKMRGNTIG